MSIKFVTICFQTKTQTLTHAVFDQTGSAPLGEGGKFVQIRQKGKKCKIAIENGDLVHCNALQFLFWVTQPLQNILTIRLEIEQVYSSSMDRTLYKLGLNILKRFLWLLCLIVSSSDQPWINLLIVEIVLESTSTLIQCFNCSVNIGPRSSSTIS